MSRNYVQGKDYRLAGSGVAATDTSIVLTSMQLPNSNALIAMSDFGDIGFITFEPETSREENASFTGITQNVNGTATLTGVTRGLTFVSPSTTDTALRKSHSGGSIVRVSNSVQFYENLANRYNTQTIFEVWSFTPAKNPKYLTQPASFGDLDLINKAFLATGVYNYFVDTGSADAIIITPSPALAAYTAGNYFFIKVIANNTGATTINVNGLGVKSLKKSVTNDLIAGDILAGQIILVSYDGTNFQLVGGIGGGSGLSGGGTKIAIDTTPVTVASTASETTIIGGAIQIPSNTLGTNNAVRFSVVVDNFQLDAGDVYIKLKYGTTTMAQVLVLSDTLAATKGVISGYIIADGATNLQKGFLNVGITNQDVEASGATNVNISKFLGSDYGTAAEDSTANLNFDITIEFSNATATNTITTEATILEKITEEVSGVQLDVYTANDTWVKPSGAKKVLVEVWGAGGGGGGGGLASTTNAGSGGGAGGGGSYNARWFDEADLGATVAVTVGASGAGGAGTNTGPNGTGGSAGTGSDFGSLVNAYGGNGGGPGGQNSAGAAGTGGTISIINPENVGGDGGAGNNTAGTGVAGSGGVLGSGGGGGGAGCNAGSSAAGAAGGITNSVTTGGGAAGGASGANGSNGTDIGEGGGGGGSNAAGTAGNGGNGGVGAGGGGGGGSNNSGISGDGGDGGRGEVRVTTFL